MPSFEEYAKQGQRLSRQWKRGQITQEQFLLESYKLSAEMKEFQYLRVASELLDARKVLHALAETDPSGYGAESSTRYCPYCNGSDGGSDEPEYDPVAHVPDCPWLAVKQFLAKE